MFNFKTKIMKKTFLTSVAAAVIMLFFFTGCDKYHRDRYTGTWEFTTEIVFYYINPYEIIKIDTVYYTGKISLGNLENELIIQHSEDDEMTLLLGTDGTLYQPFPYIYMTAHESPIGKFEKKDKISLSYFYEESNKKILYLINGLKTKGDINE